MEINLKKGYMGKLFHIIENYKKMYFKKDNNLNKKIIKKHLGINLNEFMNIYQACDTGIEYINDFNKFFKEITIGGTYVNKNVGKNMKKNKIKYAILLLFSWDKKLINFN